MKFAFTPDEGPPRLERYVEAGTLPGENLVALFDPANNLLVINRDLFEKLQPTDKHRVLRTRKTSLSVNCCTDPEPYVRDFH